MSLDPLEIRCELCATTLDIAGDESKNAPSMKDELAKIRTSLAKIAKKLDGPTK